MRLGTRGSALALAQAQQVAEQLDGAVEVVSTSQLTADGFADASDSGETTVATARDDKSRWVRHLERALLEGRLDLAVHSAKDLPGELPDGLELLGAPQRGAVEDLLIGVSSLEALSSGARVGTSSLRRSAQLRSARPDLDVVSLSGNVDTRLRKLAEGSAALDAVVLARAGLERLGMLASSHASLDPLIFIPAPGQGALALEGRTGDEAARQAAAAITDPGTLACLLAERALARTLGATCNTPIGAQAALVGGTTGVRSPSGGGSHGGAHAGAESDARAMLLRAWVGLPDGSAWIRDELTGDAGAPEGLGVSVADRMRAAGAERLLEEAEEMVLGPA